jgi:hypothetical protein
MDATTNTVGKSAAWIMGTGQYRLRPSRRRSRVKCMEFAVSRCHQSTKSTRSYPFKKVDFSMRQISRAAV